MPGPEWALMGCCIIAGLFLDGMWRRSTAEFARHGAGPRPTPAVELLRSRLGRRWWIWLGVVAVAEIALAAFVVAVLVRLSGGAVETAADAGEMGGAEMITGVHAMTGGTATAAGSGAAIWPAALVLLGLVCAAILVPANLQPLGRAGDGQPWWRHPVVGLVGATGILVIAFLPGVRESSSVSHTVWMGQSMLLAVAFPAVLVATSSRRDSPSRPSRAVAVVAPFVVTTSIAVTYLWHVPSMHTWSMSAALPELFRMFSLTVAGLALWVVVIGVRDPATARLRLITLVVANGSTSLLGLALIIAPDPIYPQMIGIWWLPAHLDQVVAGIVMMAADIAIVVPAALTVAARVDPGRHRAAAA